ncbi:hypothetical protein BDP55DRAFT_338274 [Colletotrichum godetiae]|uniref:Uncharacterized protein n=1 Tax=Colletotrichum godetiae TaxID=1209918 RepID=A0AAJ0AAI1_9PEZI|nr:uncharacterized protein BDP55DRAFT_338274 [Colletotrichum godetiae]KAK1659559.1 hypothetical protein BDP55DRAFT_338274 [Colletotrichum godetiae]
MTNGGTLRDQAGFLVKRPDTRRGTPEQKTGLGRTEEGSWAADLSFPLLSSPLFLGLCPNWCLLLQLLLLLLLLLLMGPLVRTGESLLLGWAGWLTPVLVAFCRRRCWSGTLRYLSELGHRVAGQGSMSRDLWDHQIRPGGMGRPGLVGLGWRKKSRVGQGLKGEGVGRGRGARVEGGVN